MKKSLFNKKSLWIAGALCALPVAATVPGCGGGSSGVAVPVPPVPQGNQFAGLYIGSYLVTNGPAAGTTGSFSIRIDDQGVVSFTSPDGNNTVIGSLPENLGLGAFSASLPSPTGVTFDLTGLLTRNPDGSISGNGNFVSSDGTTGTILLNSLNLTR